MMFSEYLETARLAADAAAEVISRYYGQALDIKTKPDQTPVTEADTAAEQAIHGIISERYPDHGFYGEEKGRSGGGDFLWLVDPLDGTKSFIRHYPFFSTQIALSFKNELVVGVSNAPWFGEQAWAARGLGAYLNGERISVSDCAELAQATLSSGNIASLAAGERWPAYGKLLGKVNRTRGYGDFYHYHLLASGRIDVVVESDVNILDIAALCVIVEEAGGRFTDLDLEAIGLATTTVLASNGSLHDRVKEYL
ncbi:MAG: inositol-phosphate phosphatase [Proteobacteria bacterium]|nr:inositol-phosphate phosphatase [Pseudomonadota bacterium]